MLHGEGAQRRDGPLSEHQLARFERDGFLVLHGFFKPHEVRAFLDDLEAYRHDAQLLRRPQVITEADSDQIRSIFGIHRLSARFDTLTRDARLLDLAGQLPGSDVYIHQSRLNCKPAFCGRRLPRTGRSARLKAEAFPGAGQVPPPYSSEHQWLGLSLIAESVVGTQPLS
ncbi:MAG: phytanoyl-CoA dioxygenase family protein [Pseudomonadales bacterium]